MKPTALIILAGILAVAALLLGGKASDRASRARPAGLPDRPAMVPDTREVDSTIPAKGLRRTTRKEKSPPLNPEAQAILDELNLAWADRLKKGFGSPGRHHSIRNKLLADYWEAGGSTAALLEWGSTLVASDQATGGILADIVVKGAETDGRAVVEWLVRYADDEDFANNTRVGGNWNYYFRRAAEQWIKTDSRAAIRAVEDNIDRLQSKDVRYILGDWDPGDASGAVAWVEQQMKTGAEPVSPTWTSAVAGVWAKRDPDAAGDWIEGLPPRMHAWGFGAIAVNWPEESLPAATDWIASKRDQGGEFNMAREYLANRLAKSDPRAAVNVAIDITETARQEKAIIKAGRALNQSDPESVRAWLPDSGLSEKIQAAIVPPATP